MLECWPCRALSLGQVSFELNTLDHVTSPCRVVWMAIYSSFLVAGGNHHSATHPNIRDMHACETWRACRSIGSGNGNKHMCVHESTNATIICNTIHFQAVLVDLQSTVVQSVQAYATC